MLWRVGKGQVGKHHRSHQPASKSFVNTLLRLFSRCIFYQLAITIFVTATCQKSQQQPDVVSSEHKVVVTDVAQKPEPASQMTVDPEGAKKVLLALRLLAQRGEPSAMTPFFIGRGRQIIPSMKPSDISALFSGDIGDYEILGGRVIFQLKNNPKARYAAMFLTSAGYKYDMDVSLAYAPPDRGPRVPENNDLPLQEAVKGVPGTGNLLAFIETSKGTLKCTLFEDKAPKAVANFVALARGLRAFRDVETGKWVRRPFYDGLTFHRVIPNFMIQGGCPKGNGTGDPGYAFEDEFDLSLRHDRPGRLSMANSGPNTNGSQFFITEVPTPWLDDHHTIFGECEPLDIVRTIARVPVKDTRPIEPVTINRIIIRRQE